jgi:hypothetical protein
MLKKIFLSCLTAAIVLPFHLSVSAANSTSNKSLSPILISLKNADGDLNSIRKELNELVKAINNRDKKKLLSHYSKNFKGVNGGVPDYNALVQNSQVGIDLLKAFGTIINTQNIKITKTGKNTATAELIYKTSFAKDSPLANDPASIKYNNQLQGLVFALEKNNGRWLIVSTEQATVAGAEPLITTSDRKTSSPITRQDKQTFSDFFKRHLDALNRKNLSDYIATLDPKAPQFDKTKQETAQLFKEYTLKYTIKSVKVLSINQQEAVVEMVATVKKISGGGFKDSQMTTTNLLKKTKGKWRLYDTSIDSLTDLQASK